jgi:hypothetical protein
MGERPDITKEIFVLLARVWVESSGELNFCHSREDGGEHDTCVIQTITSTDCPLHLSDCHCTGSVTELSQNPLEVTPFVNHSNVVGLVQLQYASNVAVGNDRIEYHLSEEIRSDSDITIARIARAVEAGSPRVVEPLYFVNNIGEVTPRETFLANTDNPNIWTFSYASTFNTTITEQHSLTMTVRDAVLHDVWCPCAQMGVGDFIMIFLYLPFFFRRRLLTMRWT